MNSTHSEHAKAKDDLRVVVDQPELARAEREHVSFRVERPGGEVVRDFDSSHERRMHLIVVRHDLTGFQHLHPEMAADGTWSATATLPDAGPYRLFADFSHDGEATTLSSDLRVAGPAELLDLPAPAPVAISDGGDRVQLDAGDHAARAGEASTLRFTITRDGEPVEIEPYLGASGHLVALREGDLAFLHVHPSGDGVEFATTFPTAGRYRLFLQYKVDGRVQTVGFTQEATA